MYFQGLMTGALLAWSFVNPAPWLVGITLIVVLGDLIVLRPWAPGKGV
jgi:hypothetical protein